MAPTSLKDMYGEVIWFCCQENIQNDLQPVA